MNKVIVESIGTFFLVFTIGCTVVAAPSGVIPPLAIAAVLMAMIYAGGHISGGHFNPAVTVGVAVTQGKMGTALPYIGAQLLGAGIAAALVGYIRGPAPMPSSPDVAKALIVEFLFTFALVYTVLNVATVKSHSSNSFYGLAIAAVVLSGAFAVGDISGGAFNPAVAVGVTIMGLSSLSNLWIYLLANLTAGIAAAFVFKAVYRPGA
jgi:aquaporin Z